MIPFYSSYLYQHYKSSMDFGFNHDEYIILNDIDKETSKKLKDFYEREKRIDLMFNSNIYAQYD